MKSKPNGYWNYENCKNEALKYNMRSHFMKNEAGSYNSARKNGWLDEICSHMIVVGDLYKRCIYVYEFDDNSVYVGLTYDIKERDRTHHIRGTINEKIKTNKYKLKQLTEYINIEESKKLEGIYIEMYKNKGYKILNIAKHGSVGSISIWDYDKCKNDALKYKGRFEFQKKSPSAYIMAWKSGWLNELCHHMNPLKKMWTSKEKCQEESLKYKTKTDFRKKSNGAYSSSLKNKWLDEICEHMESNWKRNFWNYQECKKESLKYSNRNEFSKKAIYVCNVSRKNGWLDEFFPKTKNLKEC